MHLGVWNFEQSFLNIYICHFGHPKLSTLHSGIRYQDSLKEALDPCRRMNLEVWHFAQSFLNLYIYHSWHPKLARFYSGIKNVFQDSLVDILETHRRFSSSNSPRGLKFCTELPKCLYKSFLIHKVHCQLDSILESKMSSQTPWRTQRKVGVLSE